MFSSFGGSVMSTSRITSGETVPFVHLCFISLLRALWEGRISRESEGLAPSSASAQSDLIYDTIMMTFNNGNNSSCSMHACSIEA